MPTALQTVKIDRVYYKPGDTIPKKVLTAAIKDQLPDGAVDFGNAIDNEKKAADAPTTTPAPPIPAATETPSA